METPEAPRSFPALERPREAYRYEPRLDAELIEQAFDRITFVRHVKTPYKEEGKVGRLQGSINVLLPDTAIEVAVRAAETFSQELDAPVHRVYTPELARAFYTAAIFEGTLTRAGQLRDGLAVVPELNEFRFGEWQGKLIGEELHDDEVHQIWQQFPVSASEEGILPGCEGFIDFLQRTNHGLRQVAGELPADAHTKSVVVTCGMSWRAMGYLRYLSAEGVEHLEAEAVEPHQYRFFNTASGRFNTLGYAGG